MYHKQKLSELNYFQISREIRIHSQLDHQNIVQLVSATQGAGGRRVAPLTGGASPCLRCLGRAVGGVRGRPRCLPHLGVCRQGGALKELNIWVPAALVTACSAAHAFHALVLDVSSGRRLFRRGAARWFPDRGGNGPAGLWAHACAQ